MDIILGDEHYSALDQNVLKASLNETALIVEILSE